MDMMAYMVYFVCVVILGVIGFQVALIVGAPWGRLTQGGQVDGALPLSGRIIAALSIAILAAIALALLSADGYWPYWPRWTAWPAVAVIFVSTVLNWITPSVAERKLWGPIMTVILCLTIAIVWL
ncbi:hypothetical protein [Yoonia sediminilitoris]|uniref:Small integral membrane protein n=1 Tax=Yoonia sediminilitoris TaxID=1286148 RepID=A0A2T6KM88_9RHOB|nr:hypothetical protein [Yoonia sediminilitoris]PUB17329.1 hypothetical protein C8N45_102341 [Yoonia sediminilitoris]RCW97624.1 hypothetical protein DFP92_102341 [Yoonia sediminilitoris]